MSRQDEGADPKTQEKLEHEDAIEPWESLLFRRTPQFVMNLLHHYFRVEVTGLENIPSRGRALIVPNHSGFSGFDAAILGHEIFRHLGRPSRILTHYLWFLHYATAYPLNKFGFFEASLNNGVKFLRKNNLVIVFPEGERGNFKPSSEAYQLQEFKRGFVRMALKTGSPIIPTIVIGAEETHLNLATLNLGGVRLPVPLNILPLPAKWKIRFLKPFELPISEEKLGESELIREIASDIRDLMQEAIKEEIEKRKTVYF